MKETKIISILRGIEKEKILNVAEALYKGGQDTDLFNRPMLILKD